MRRLILLSCCLLLCCAGLTAQTWLKATGIDYYSTKPTHIPTIKYGGQLALAVDNNTLYQFNRDSLAWYELSGGGANIDFDSDRPVLRTPQEGDVIGGSTLADFANYFYFAPPTINLSQVPSGTVYEVGTNNSININTSTQNDGGSTLSNGRVFVVGGADIASFGANTSTSTPVTFYPLAPTTISYRAEQEWSGGGNSGTVTSNTRTVEAVHAVLYGFSTTDFFADDTGFYAAMTKMVVREGNYSRNFTGTNGYIYYAIPSSWNDTNLSSIQDPNGFETVQGFAVQTISVTTTDNDTDYTIDYTVYQNPNISTYNNSSYEFIR